MTTPLFLLRCVQIGLSISELDLLTIGTVNDMYAEMSNDDYNYPALATQEQIGGHRMADRIKGITVEIGGDTTGLSKALSGVNKEIKSTQSQLKDVNKLLKLDPTNTTLLEQKQKLLQQAVSETKEKLTQLKSVQDQMDAGLKNGTVTQQQYDAWQREIIETENELKNLEQQCRETDTSITATLRATGSKLQEVGGKISDVGTSLSTHVTAPIVAIGAASIAAFNEVDAGLDIVAQKTGATGDELEDMCQIVKDLATEIPTDFETAGAAVGEVNTRFGAQ